LITISGFNSFTTLKTLLVSEMSNSYFVNAVNSCPLLV